MHYPCVSNTVALQFLRGHEPRALDICTDSDIHLNDFIRNYEFRTYFQYGENSFQKLCSMRARTLVAKNTESDAQQLATQSVGVSVCVCEHTQQLATQKATCSNVRLRIELLRMYAGLYWICEGSFWVVMRRHASPIEDHCCTNNWGRETGNEKLVRKREICSGVFSNEIYWCIFDTHICVFI